MPTSRRVPIRVDNQDGPWTISVAENDPYSYSIYIKTPTHNITLTRTALEIVELHGKLRDSHPGYKMFTLPLDPAAIPAPPKRKSAFLNTLSRLASPSAKSAQRQASTRQHAPSTSSNTPSSTVSSTHPTPLGSPRNELNDPFSGADDEDDLQPPLAPANSTVTALAGYLTTLANDAVLHNARVWRRFVRVRTDDLQSVRVERAIKRVRSDLAAHVSPGSAKEAQRSISQVVLGEESPQTKKAAPPPADVVPNGNGIHAAEPSSPERPKEADIQEEEEPQAEVVPVANGVHVDGQDQSADAADAAKEAGDMEDGAAEDRAPTPRSPRASSVVVDGPGPIDTAAAAAASDADTEDDTSAPSTPVPSDGHAHAARIPRSQSADPTSRASRIFLPSPLASEADSSQTSQAGESADDSSVSTTGRRAARKARSKSMDPGAQAALQKKSQRKVAIDDFEMMRVLGKGCAGKVLLVRHKPTADVFALKAITKRHVLAHQELQHTLTEQAVLKRMAAEGSDPFVVKLWWSFHDKENLFLVMDFHPGGDLATQLARWGRLGRDRARFYAAEIVEGVEGLHAAGVIYRDLKPENILIGADGHIVLTDFGLSKEFPRRTSPTTAPPTPSGFRGDFTAGTPVAATPQWMKGEKGQELANGWAPSGPLDTTTTFCGTAEYLAPEVIQGQAYSYEVDWWSFGTMLYEMLTGITPFWANNHSDMYYRVLQDELQFPEDRTMDQDTKSLIRGLLQRNPALRMKEPRIKKHPYFSMIDWSHVYFKRYIPPYIPPIDPSNASDTQNFDDTFLDMEPVINDENENEQSDTDQDRQTDTDRTDGEGEDSVVTPSQSRSPSVRPDDAGIDVFDGYSFKGRHSIIMDNEDEEADEEDEDEEEDTSTSAASTDNVLLEQQLSQTAANSAIILAEGATATEEAPEPKTPEAKAPALPEPVAPASPVREQPAAKKAPAPRRSHEAGTERGQTETAARAAPEEIKPAKAVPIPKAQPRPTAGRQRGRREKSGIAALDRDLSDVHDEDELATEREEEDDEWDFVEAEVVEERNGAKGTSLFARGVVDRYKLAVFRKSTPRRSGGPRSFSGMSVESDVTGSEPAGDSPTPADKQRRGRTPGLTFRKHPKQFLRQRSPQASTRSSTTGKTLTHSTSGTLTTSTLGSTGFLSPSGSGASTLPNSPSLRSKESALSMGSPSESSDQSINGEGRNNGDNTIRGNSVVSIEEDKQKSKVLKKYKEGAEKVLSIFQSPR
ncbi:hypothetical protein POSPLADRAFT_1175504 [Postia placenta MAD-698-R-SB12]|uniref:Protein kinase domain-containing protein n=1 Tax=Postia placenta MAD-698-R-SB12 TaxID=670580 RepID=A0A1X6NE15_9APHY|nr:hypothetical protein POSPLADRAFT_1175504 [Postia placenta MAD-698-R-SB12]OSX66814.1 hypothetical protein POSPLADRAFT_1175504 [Postia placenta MAD-698-R-SB12]